MATIRQYYTQTDRQTDRQPTVAIRRIARASRGKNRILIQYVFLICSTYSAPGGPK